MKLPIFLKQYKDLWRERTFVLVLLLIFFVVISLSLLIAVTAFVFNPEFLLQENVKIGIQGTVDLEGLSPKIDFIPLESMEQGEQLFDNGTIDGYIIQRYISPSSYTFDVVIPANPVKNSIVSSLLQDLFHTVQDEVLSANVEYDLLSPSDIRSARQPIRGLDQIYQILFGFALPLFLLIPIFLLGNLFVDTITEDFERKNNAVLFTATSPLRYAMEMLLFGLIAAIVLVGILQLVLYLRFWYLSFPGLVFLYAILFFGIIGQLGLIFSFWFELKIPAQLSYSFSVLSIFLVSPYVTYFPIKVMSLAMLGIQAWHPWYVLGAVVINVLLFGLLYGILKKKYFI